VGNTRDREPGVNLVWVESNVPDSRLQGQFVVGRKLRFVVARLGLFAPFVGGFLLSGFVLALSLPVRPRRFCERAN
jgi:hypothetical protein